MSADGMTPVEHDPFSGPALVARLPLTEAQREIWLAVQTLPECALAYNECGSLTLEGPLDVAALCDALQTLVDRHEALRATFSPDGEWMCVRSALQAPIEQRDISADPARLRREAEAEAVGTAFDLENGPLIRWLLLRESAQRHHLVKIAHHIIVDGWSSWVISSELSQLYSAKVEKREANLKPAPRYGDYAQIERDFVASAEGQAHFAYWLKTLESPPNIMPMPHDRPRPAQRSFDARRLDIPLDPALVGRLRKLGSQHGASLVATTLAAFVATLHRQSGQEDMIIGLAAAGQSFHQQNNLVGHAVNLLPLRLKPRPDQVFADLLKDTRAHVLDAFDHQGVSFGGIVPQLKFERDPSRPPLVPIMFNIDVRSGDVVFSGLKTRYRTLDRRGEIFEFFVNMVDDGSNLLLECSYNANLFSEEAVRARMADYEKVLATVCEQPQAPLRELSLLGPAATSAWERLNATATPPPGWTVPERVADQAHRNPAAIALRFGKDSLSYQQLNAAADALAGRLAAAGAGPGSFVGVCLQRGPDLPVALLAVLKCGAAYVPLDPEFPPERLRYYLEDSKAKLLLADAASAAKLPSPPCPVLEVGTDQMGLAPSVRPKPESAAYAIYTSGSTGKPKGVVVPHGALANFLDSFAREPGLRAGDVLAAVTTVSFDIAGLELWLPLCVGATVALIDRDTAMDGELLKAALAAHKATVMQATPSTWRLLLAANWEGSKSLRAYCGGEPLPRDLAEQLLPKVGELWNLYGPTETTIWSTIFQVQDPAQPLLVGKPIANTQCYVLDKQGQLLPPGITGELWIGGAGLALGYHERAELTAEKFVTHPRLGKLYNTGDLARLTGGGLECLGRVDFQVKLRGFRIELGEIEYALSRHEGMADSAVLVRERAPGDPRLVAYISSRNGRPFNTGELRTRLRDFLPPYMLPQQFVELPALPRLPNGKLDRKALPDPFANSAAPVSKTPPRNPAEQAVAAVWAEVLGVKDIGVDDRFFDLGGHSLLAVRVAGRLQKDFGLKLPLRSILMESVAGLAAQLPAGAVKAAAPAPVSDGPTEPILKQTPPKPGLWGRLFGKSGR